MRRQSSDRLGVRRGISRVQLAEPDEDDGESGVELADPSPQRFRDVRLPLAPGQHLADHARRVAAGAHVGEDERGQRRQRKRLDHRPAFRPLRRVCDHRAQVGRRRRGLSVEQRGETGRVEASVRMRAKRRRRHVKARSHLALRPRVHILRQPMDDRPLLVRCPIRQCAEMRHDGRAQRRRHRRARAEARLVHISDRDAEVRERRGVGRLLRVEVIVAQHGNVETAAECRGEAWSVHQGMGEA